MSFKLYRYNVDQLKSYFGNENSYLRRINTQKNVELPFTKNFFFFVGFMRFETSLYLFKTFCLKKTKLNLMLVKLFRFYARLMYV